MPKKTQNRKSGKNTILLRIMLPGMAVIIAQSIIYSLIFWQYNIISRIETNAYDIFSEKVLNRQQDIQSDILHKSMALDSDRAFLMQKIYDSLAKNGAESSQISASPALNRQIVVDVSEYLVDILHRHTANGVFLVLDGPAIDTVEQGSFSRAGFYIRQFGNLNRSTDNSDLLMERGMPDLARSLGISLDRYWSADFTFSNETDAQSQFFFAPLNAAKANPGGQSADFGHWSTSFSLSNNDINIITYSVPLITSDGSVIGVFGVELSESQLVSKMRYNNLSSNQNASYFIGVSSDGGHAYHKVFTSGPLFKSQFGSTQTISISKAEHENIYLLDNESNTPIIGAVYPFDLYKVNTPFYNDQWVVIGMVDQNDLLLFSNKIRVQANVAFFFSLFLGITGMLIISKMVTDPIYSLVTSIKQSDPTGCIHLKKTNIFELDELAMSFESLSHAVVSASEKTALIFAMTQISVGVFEYDRNRSQVFCSSNLCRILDWFEQPEKDYVYLERSDFEKRMFSLSPYIFEKSEMIFQLFDHEGKAHWMQINITEQDGKVLGAVSDITDDILAKQKMEYERDYDPLTNLYNLRAFRSQLMRLLNLHNLKTAALVMWDLDNLKRINDSYGHDFGDSYIKAFAECLEEIAQHNALVARRSGDEFYTLLYGYSSKDEIRNILDKTRHVIRQKQLLLPDGSTCPIDVSSGLAWYPTDTVSGDELLRFADFAMYNVKHDIKGSCREFDPVLYHESVSVLDGYGTIKQLTDNALFKFALQPILSVKTGSVYGYEMLMRPQIAGDYSPYDVFHMAQVHSKLYHLENISFYGGMETFISHVEQQSIGKDEKVFINSISNQIMTFSDLLAFERRFAPYLHRIAIEITASGRDNQDCIHLKKEFLHRWKGLLAIDDYGLGYNNEAALQYIAPKLIKIDISLISGIDKDQNRHDILKTIVSTARKHHVAVLAEGIETEAELKTVIAGGVEYVQGFFIARPSFEIAPIPQKVLDAIASARQVCKL
ncbi:MAG: putative diguanylate kinase signaling protein [Oscillospiraceae bacterium]|jgi:diguanylate cyclase (GGDEF)-like protein|nr:putative diguanylate kinase signaling protein [Oscillospiraceae bacterium]